MNTSRIIRSLARIDLWINMIQLERENLHDILSGERKLDDGILSLVQYEFEIYKTRSYHSNQRQSWLEWQWRVLNLIWMVSWLTSFECNLFALDKRGILISDFLLRNRRLAEGWLARSSYLNLISGTSESANCSTVTCFFVLIIPPWQVHLWFFFSLSKTIEIEWKQTPN
jgi:hypothetical protein